MRSGLLRQLPCPCAEDRRSMQLWDLCTVSTLGIIKFISYSRVKKAGPGPRRSPPRHSLCSATTPSAP